MWRDKWTGLKAQFVQITRLSWNDFITGLPDTIPDPINLTITGGLTRNGFTENDIDFMLVGDRNNAGQYTASLDAMTTELFGKGSHIGHRLVDARPPNVVVELYQNGVLKDREALKALVTEQDNKIQVISGTLKGVIERIESLETQVSAEPK